MYVTNLCCFECFLRHKIIGRHCCVCFISCIYMYKYIRMYMMFHSTKDVPANRIQFFASTIPIILNNSIIHSVAHHLLGFALILLISFILLLFFRSFFLPFLVFLSYIFSPCLPVAWIIAAPP